jgi:hypothetical protein
VGKGEVRQEKEDRCFKQIWEGKREKDQEGRKKEVKASLVQDSVFLKKYSVVKWAGLEFCSIT